MDSQLKVHAKGNAFKDRTYDLRALELLVASYRSVLDRLIAVQLGKRNLPEKTKKELSYKVQIQDGSIELLIDFVLENPGILSFFAQDGGHQLAVTLTKLYREAIDLRKAAAEFIEKGLNFNIKISNSFNIGSNNSNVIVENGDIIIADPKILFAAQATRWPTDKLLRNIDGSNIQKVDLISPDETFTLNTDKKNILGRDKQILPARLTIVGRLDVVAFSSHRGVIVSDADKYQVTWDDNIRSKMQTMADKDGILFTAQPVIDHSRLDNDAIGFHILDCEAPPNDELG